MNGHGSASASCPSHQLQTFHAQRQNHLISPFSGSSSTFGISTCRPLQELDVFVLRFYLLRNPTSQTMSPEITSPKDSMTDREPNSQSSKSMTTSAASLARWSPFFQEMVQRAVAETVVLDSLLCATILLLADTYQSNVSLLTASQQLSVEAVSNLRLSVHAQRASTTSSMSIKICALHLCMGSLRAGDMKGCRNASPFPRLDVYGSGLPRSIRGTNTGKRRVLRNLVCA